MLQVVTQSFNVASTYLSCTPCGWISRGQWSLCVNIEECLFKASFGMTWLETGCNGGRMCIYIYIFVHKSVVSSRPDISKDAARCVYIFLRYAFSPILILSFTSKTERYTLRSRGPEMEKKTISIIIILLLFFFLQLSCRYMLHYYRPRFNFILL